MDDFVFEQIASIAKMPKWKFKHDVLLGVLIAAGFIDKRVLQRAKKRPWNLLLGDMRADLIKLRDGPDEVEETAQAASQAAGVSPTRTLKGTHKDSRDESDDDASVGR